VADAAWLPAIDWSLLAQLLMVGAGYALAAVGLTVIFGILQQVNFAHGEIYTAGAYLFFLVLTQYGLSYAASFFVVLPVMAAVGVLLASVALVPTLDRPFEAAILATLAVGIVIQNAVRLTFGASPLKIETPFAPAVLEIFGVLLFGQRVCVLAVAGLVFALLWVALRFTRLGRAMRAAAQNKDACRMVGIDIRRITMWTAALGGVLCTTAAGAIAPLFDLYPNMGTDVVFKSFAVVIIGGMGNLVGALVAGLLLGEVESVVGGLFSTGLRDGASFALMILVLLARPHGLFGRTVRL
jgi:branched-chain amino acid transport system permease protein